MKHSCIVWMWLKVDDPQNGWSSSCSKHQIIVPPQRVEPDIQDGIDDVPQKFPTQLSAFSRKVHSNALCHTDIYTCLGQWQPPGGSVCSWIWQAIAKSTFLHTFRHVHILSSISLIFWKPFDTSHRTGWWENLPEPPYIWSKNHGFRLRFSLKPIHWHLKKPQLRLSGQDPEGLFPSSALRGSWENGIFDTRL